jgi:hypothetical protein
MWSAELSFRVRVHDTVSTRSMSKVVSLSAISGDVNPFVEDDAIGAVGFRDGTVLLACMLWCVRVCVFVPHPGIGLGLLLTCVQAVLFPTSRVHACVPCAQRAYAW